MTSAVIFGRDLIGKGHCVDMRDFYESMRKYPRCAPWSTISSPECQGMIGTLPEQRMQPSCEELAHAHAGDAVCRGGLL